MAREMVARTETFFSVNTLDYLQRVDALAQLAL